MALAATAARRWRAGGWIGALLFAATAASGAAVATPDPVAVLNERLAALKAGFEDNVFHRPVHLASSESADRMAGDVHSLASQPFAAVRAALEVPALWCDILILHINTKYCRPSTVGGATVLHLRVGRKFDQPVDAAYRLDLTYRVVARTADYLRVDLDAAEGPLGTTNYRIVLEATPVEGGKTFLHLSYSYAYGLAGQLGMQAYLATAGRDKVGFTVIGTEADGRPRSVGGMRGVVERNTMRYYLAIDAFLGALPLASEARLEKSLADWFAATERYPRQLHELDRVDYLALKRREYARQQTGGPAP